MTLFTANLVAGALLISIIGATVAMAIRHITAIEKEDNNKWMPNIRDAWYYVLSGTLAVCLVLLGFDTPTIIAATTGVNTPLAVLQSGIDKYTDKKSGVALNAANIDAIKKELERREAALRVG